MTSSKTHVSAIISGDLNCFFHLRNGCHDQRKTSHLTLLPWPSSSSVFSAIAGRTWITPAGEIFGDGVQPSGWMTTLSSSVRGVVAGSPTLARFSIGFHRTKGDAAAKAPLLQKDTVTVTLVSRKKDEHWSNDKSSLTNKALPKGLTWHTHLLWVVFGDKWMNEDFSGSDPLILIHLQHCL